MAQYIDFNIHILVVLFNPNPCQTFNYKYIKKIIEFHVSDKGALKDGLNCENFTIKVDEKTQKFFFFLLRTTSDI